MKYKYDFQSTERTDDVKEILKNHNIPCKIDGTIIELFDPYIWIDEDVIKSEKRFYDLIGLKKCQNDKNREEYLYFNVPKFLGCSQTWSFPTDASFNNAIGELMENNIEAVIDLPRITVKPPYFWKIIGNKVFLQKRIAKTIAEFNNKY